MSKGEAKESHSERDMRSRSAAEFHYARSRFFSALAAIFFRCSLAYVLQKTAKNPNKIE
jgi:hypothetical protein